MKGNTMKWALGVLVVVMVLAPTFAFACPPPAAPDYSGPAVGDGPIPPGSAYTGDTGNSGSDGILPPPGDISTQDFVL
ncbi:MAG: hypothetical protein HZA54_17165 [Planctomycetes bacterium]|nr:hypothetical protein [Planctomycetota bacterium]